MSLTYEDAKVAALWVGFGVFHSVFATHRVKEIIAKTIPGSERWYRLVYNVASLSWCVPLGMFSLTAPPPETAIILHTGAERWVMDGLALLAQLGAINTCFAYDMLYFAGIREKPSKPLGWSFLHRFVRNPWYTCALVMLWTRSMDQPKLISTIFASAYLFIGTMFEERRLRGAPGNAGAVYRQYCELVPSIIPRPWQYLTAAQMAALFAAV